MNFPADLRYSQDHEWCTEPADGVTTVGVTGYAAESLGDVVFVQLPEVGTTVAAGEVCGEIESTKSVSDLYAPVTGEVVEVNQAVVDDPALVNAEPHGRGWLFRVRVEALPAELLDAAGYGALVGAEA
ncbi:glycine cleavage system H protein [Longimycelium tulufanense]|uniref:Glycine cleavage system H protein n=1 Tax=Longimycelium tulufanense TaxID=907463 RepID=A0A8J3FTE8_9PSEU|nr:glycine cleavage system protein GcvH [Longimycelium tulufanense]GGM45419.1 glycine cleavage system H protein [Longimycelium tulufanense]